MFRSKWSHVHSLLISKTKQQILRLLCVGLVAAILTSSVESRADSLAPPTIDEAAWHFDLTPLLDLLNFALSGRLEAWKGDYGIILDAFYTDVGAGGTVASPGPLPLNVAIDADVTQFYVDGLGSYRVVNEPYNADGDLWSLELMAGVRYNYLKQKINLAVSGGPGPGVATTLGGSERWVDPMLGARAVAGLSERWTAGVRGDIGGFGISDTDLTWSLTGGFDYRPWDKTSVKFGWRAYSIDYETTLSDGTFAYDAFMHGPYVAITFRFQ
jgi:opacity protein-like surface antigen